MHRVLELGVPGVLERHVAPPARSPGPSRSPRATAGRRSRGSPASGCRPRPGTARGSGTRRGPPRLRRCAAGTRWSGSRSAWREPPVELFAGEASPRDEGGRPSERTNPMASQRIVNLQSHTRLKNAMWSPISDRSPTLSASPGPIASANPGSAPPGAAQVGSMFGDDGRQRGKLGDLVPGGLGVVGAGLDRRRRMAVGTGRGDVVDDRIDPLGGQAGPVMPALAGLCSGPSSRGKIEDQLGIMERIGRWGRGVVRGIALELVDGFLDLSLDTGDLSQCDAEFTTQRDAIRTARDGSGFESGHRVREYDLVEKPQESARPGQQIESHRGTERLRTVFLAAIALFRPARAVSTRLADEVRKSGDRLPAPKEESIPLNGHAGRVACPRFPAECRVRTAR